MKKSSDNNISQYVNKYLTNKWLHYPDISIIEQYNTRWWWRWTVDSGQKDNIFLYLDKDLIIAGSLLYIRYLYPSVIKKIFETFFYLNKSHNFFL
jgi:hypothetical protein